MLAVTLTIGTLVSIMFFFVGGVVGWLAKEHFYMQLNQFIHTQRCLMRTEMFSR